MTLFVYTLVIMIFISLFGSFLFLKEKTDTVLVSLQTILKSEIQIGDYNYFSRSVNDLYKLKYFDCIEIRNSSENLVILSLWSSRNCSKPLSFFGYKKKEQIKMLGEDFINITIQVVPSKVHIFSCIFISILISIIVSLIYKLHLNKIHFLESKSLLAAQISHDIRSPLSALNMVVGTIKNISEDQKIIIRSAVNRINDIANQLLQKNTKTNSENSLTLMTNNNKSESQLPKQTIELLPSIVDAIISEKRFQYRERASILIEADLEESYGAFARIDSVEFKRVLSNLINNAVEALPKNSGKVVVSVKNYNSKKLVVVRDNGIGIPKHIIAKLGERGITYGKEQSSSQSGSGLGIYHAKKTIESFGAIFLIQSEENLGTEIRMEFPKCDEPIWYVPEINLGQNQYVAALDDDQSILQVWSQRFKDLVSDNVNLYTFSSGNEFCEWTNRHINSLTEGIYLVDYELEGQLRNGLDLIEDLKIGQKSILVTSRYEEPKIRERCEKLKVKIIPKGVVGHVPIKHSLL